MKPEVDEHQRIVMLKVSNKEDLPDDFSVNYHTHILCHRGSITFVYNEVKMKCSRNEFVF